MNCYQHPDVAAVAFCRTCGKPLCQVCQRSVEGTIVCEEHAPQQVAPPPAPRAAPADYQVAAVPVVTPVAPPPPPLPERAPLRLDRQEIATLIKRGEELLNNGDFSSARLLLRRAAEAGSADAALTLGSTYDPLTIQRLGAIGAKPDIARARKWYQKAVELGSDSASEQLDKLAQAAH